VADQVLDQNPRLAQIIALGDCQNVTLRKTNELSDVLSTVGGCFIPNETLDSDADLKQDLEMEEHTLVILPEYETNEIDEIVDIVDNDD
jgi:hypothetical protein